MTLTAVAFARASAGGKIARFSSEYDSSSHAVKNLIDGNPGRSWAGKSADPQFVVVELGRAWGSRIVDLGEVGHLNPASGYGPWLRAESFIHELATTADAAA